MHDGTEQAQADRQQGLERIPLDSDQSRVAARNYSIAPVCFCYRTIAITTLKTEYTASSQFCAVSLHPHILNLTQYSNTVYAYQNLRFNVNN